METLREARFRQGFTAEEVARKAGVARDSVYRAEVGKKPVRKSTFQVICSALGVLPEEITGTKLYNSVTDRKGF